MPRYTYIAIDPRGVRVSGEMEANIPDDVITRLTADGLRIESIKTDRPASAAASAGAAEMTAGEAREISGHIAGIVSAGLPLEAGLAAIAEEFPRGRLRRTLLAIVRDLQTGADLESVLAARRAPAFLPALLRAGRRSGKTGDILDNFIASSGVISEMRQTLWMSLLYPVVLLLLLIPLGTFLVQWVIPDFAAVFDGFEIKLPLFTSIVLGGAKLVREQGLLVLGSVLAAAATVAIVLRLGLGAVGTRRLIVGLPILGPLIRWLAMARFAPLLSLLIESRVPLDEALVLAGDAAGDAEIREDCRLLAGHVQAGQQLEEAARMSVRLPASFIRALSWEAYRDAFPDVLQSVAEMYAGRARALVMLLATLLPPLIVLFVGIGVAFIVVALFVPLLELLNKLS